MSYDCALPATGQSHGPVTGTIVLIASRMRSNLGVGWCSHTFVLSL